MYGNLRQDNSWKGNLLKGYMIYEMQGNLKNIR